MTSVVDIQFATQAECPDVKTIKKWVMTALSHQKKDFSLSLKIVDEDEMTELNSHYRQKQKPTNVLSFPCTLPDVIKGNTLGDIAICVPVVTKEAIEQDKTFEEHFALMVIHGTLHLLGYDHENEQDAHTMESLETALLKQLGFANPYRVEISHD